MIQADQDRIQQVVDLAASVSRVWRALTDHEEFGEWFKVRLNGPFRVGEVTTGRITYPGHEDMVWESVTERMDREHVFAFSWPPAAVDPENSYDDGAKIVVEFRLEPIERGTRLTITESGFMQFPDSKRREVLQSNTEGWAIQAQNVKNYTES